MGWMGWDGMGWDGSPGGPRYRAPTVLIKAKRVTLDSICNSSDVSFSG